MNDAHISKHEGTSYQRLHRAEWFLAADSEPPVGAHVVTQRRGYTHHGIDVGASQVVHYTGLARGLRRGPVEEISLSSFAAGDAVRVMAGRNSTFERSSDGGCRCPMIDVLQHCFLLRIVNDDRGPYPPSVAYVISTAGTVSNPARAQAIRRQWKRRFLSLAGSVRRLPAPKSLMLAFFNRLTTAIRSAIGRIEFAFSAFANVPYQDAQTRLELMQLLEDLKVDYSEGW